MAFIYEKKDPGNNKRRWYARIKIGSWHETVSLKLLAPENKRLAAQRAGRLQVECDVASISEETRGWLGDKTALRLMALTGEAGLTQKSGEPACWESAWKGYLEAKSPKDTPVFYEGKAAPEEGHARYTRMCTTRSFVRWTQAESVPFMAEPFTNLIKRYIAWRLTKVSPNTVRTMDYPYLCGWGDWLAGRNLCEKPNRPLILEGVPEKIPPNIVLPSWRDDVDALRFYHSKRDEPVVGSTWRKPKGYHAIWALILVIRGLGCRPSEATRLTWESVDLKTCRVRFLFGKKGTNRTVPIVYQWVHDGLVELADRNGRSGAVCLSATDTPYSKGSVASYLLNRSSYSDDRQTYLLKVAQKLWIRQIIHDGFPPHVVANWANHTLAMQESHYCEADAYLPPDEDLDYGEFGALSPFGKRTREHLSAFSRDVASEWPRE